MSAIMTFLTEALAELHQVRWPTRQQAIRLSAIVIAFTTVTSIAFGATDYVLALGLKGLLSFTY